MENCHWCLSTNWISGDLLCFSFVYSELFSALFLVIQWILIDFIIFIIQVFFYNKKISFGF